METSSIDNLVFQGDSSLIEMWIIIKINNKNTYSK